MWRKESESLKNGSSSSQYGSLKGVANVNDNANDNSNCNSNSNSNSKLGMDIEDEDMNKLTIDMARCCGLEAWEVTKQLIDGM